MFGNNGGIKIDDLLKRQLVWDALSNIFKTFVNSNPPVGYPDCFTVYSLILNMVQIGSKDWQMLIAYISYFKNDSRALDYLLEVSETLDLNHPIVKTVISLISINFTKGKDYIQKILDRANSEGNNYMARYLEVYLK